MFKFKAEHGGPVYWIFSGIVFICYVVMAFVFFCIGVLALAFKEFKDFIYGKYEDLELWYLSRKQF